MDLATIIGLVLAVASLIGAFLVEAMDLAPPPLFFGLIQVTAIMIVFGGTTATLLVSYPLETVIRTLTKALLKGFFPKGEHDGAHVVDIFVRLSEKARREGLLSLEEEEAALHDDFLKKGIGLVVDGQDPELIRAVLEIEVEQMRARHEESAKLLEKAGAFAPTMGIIGTVMGLINVLANLSDPSQLGPKVSVAFVATLYGVMSANLFWIPLGNKLKVRSEEEAIVKVMMIEGILAVQAGENPRIIKEKLEGFLPPAARARKVVEEAAPAEEIGEPEPVGAR